MTARCAPASNPAPLFMVECSYGRLGREFQATDRDANSRVEIVRQIRSGAIDPVKILLVDEAAGTVADVTEELIAEAAEQAREVPELEDLRQRLVDLARDRRRDYLKNEGLFGW